MSEWKEIKIDQLCEAIIDCVNKTAPIVDEITPYRMIRTTNVKDGRIDLSSTNYVTEDVFRKWTRRSTLQKGDIILTREAPLGEVGKIIDGGNLFLGQRLMMYRPDPDIVDPDFLFYAFLSKEIQYQIKSFGMGSTVEHMRVGDCSEIIFKVPSLQEQREIGKTLSILDRKIENLRKQNETLERIAQTLFKHWFVDFEFPNEDGKPYKSSGGEMVRSELGEIPAGWRVGKLGDFCNIKHGYAFSGEFITTEETNQILLTPGNFRIGGGFNSSKYKYYSDYDYDEEYILTPGDLIVTMTDLSKEGDTLGYPAFVPKYSKNIFLHNQRLGKVVDSRIDLFFLFFLLCRREYRSHILGTASGSTVRHTSPSRILEYKFADPARELLDRFSLTASNLICKSFSNHAQIETLAKTRDMLLPKLMSGKLRITAS